MKMRTIFSNAPTNNAKISAKRPQECYNDAYRDARQRHDPSENTTIHGPGTEDRPGDR
jgi:hypothetical protein